MAKILTVLLVVLLAVPACGKTLDSLLMDVRKLTGDVGTAKTPFTWPDSTIEFQINQAIMELGVMGLAVTVWDTLTLKDDTLNYILAREPIELQTAFKLDQAGGVFGLSLVNINEYWQTDDQNAYTMVDNQVFVTQRISEQHKLVVVYTATPILKSPGDDSVDVEIPDAIEPAVVYIAAANLLHATRVQLNAGIGAVYRQTAMEMINRWMRARRGKRTDSLAIPR